VTKPFLAPDGPRREPPVRLQYNLQRHFAPFSFIHKQHFTVLRQPECVLTLKRVEPARPMLSGAASRVDAQTAGPGVLAGTASEALPISLALGRYQLRLAETLLDREAAGRLRFKVFNIELGEGLESSCRTGLDQDHFDLFCDHLIVEDCSRGEIVGTYRMQSGATAERNLGYYSEQEFDFAPFSAIRNEVLELGRASIHREHRTSEVLTLLWRGIAQYARYYRLRYLIGCSSLNSRDPQEGWSLYRQLKPFIAEPAFLTSPAPAYALSAERTNAVGEVKVPRLLKTYIAVGARICGAPAWDREFGTIDFLTLLDLAQLSPAARSRFLPEPDASRPHSGSVFVS
jgi:putative hemolysin